MTRTTGPVERAIRANLRSGAKLATPTRGKPFTLARIDEPGIVLLLGAKEAWTPLRWECLEGIVPFLTGRGWVEVGSKVEVASDPTTLDGYLKRCTKTLTANWVAVVLEAAGGRGCRAASACASPGSGLVER